MAEPFEREAIARVFDGYADAEWSRHETSPFARVSFHVHRHYLGRFVRPGDRVLEVGAGPGRFPSSSCDSAHVSPWWTSRPSSSG